MDWFGEYVYLMTVMLSALAGTSIAVGIAWLAWPDSAPFWEV